MKNIFILVGPSGAGKDYLLENLLNIQKKLYCIPSYTTRPPRTGEGVREYHYVDNYEFEKAWISGKILEKVVEHQHLYGTDKEAIDRERSNGRSLITIVEPRGVESFKKEYGDSVKSIYIDPGSIDDLEQRIRTDSNRIGQTEKEISIRLKREKREIAYKDKADFVVSNKNGKENNALRQLKHIIENETHNS